MAQSRKRRLTPSDESDDSIATPQTTEDLNVKFARKKVRRLEESNEASADEQSEYEDLEIDNEPASRRASASASGSANTHKQMDISEHGTISRVEVVNFMCHKYLKVDFGPKINFVIGHNGSGKSAILTAITIALGAKATSTNRGKNLSSLIREGSNAALAVVHLTNKGPDAYKNDVYGDIIQIERKLLRDGSGGYKIKSSSGKIISTKREELIAICDHMSIQVDNPLTMLSQDNARQFLNASSSHEKYQLFMRGTQLGFLAERYAEFREHLDMMKSHIDRQKDILPDRQRKLKEAEARYKQLLEAQEIDVNIDKKQEEMAWAQIIGKEKEVEKLKKDVEVAEQHVRAAQETYKTFEGEIAVVADQIKAIEAERDSYKQSLNPSEEARNAVEREKVAKEMELKTIHADTSDTNAKFKAARQQIAKYEQLIAAENAKLESSTQTKKRELKEKIERLTEKKNEKEAQQKADLERRSRLMAEYTEKKGDLEEIEKKLQILRSRDSHIKRRLHELQAQKANGLKAYGFNMPEVLREIASETRWRGRTPVGPIGSYLKLKYPQYTAVLEIVLNKQLNAFIVENFADRQLLTRILQRNKLERTPVIVAKYDLFSYEEGEPDEKYLTILRALEFDNEWVKRQLIISSDIEKTILMEDREEANKVMYNRPHNVKTCYTSSCVQVGAAQGMRSESMNPYRGPPRLTKDIEPEIQEAEKELKRIAQEISELADKDEKLKYERLALQRQLSAIDNTQNTLFAEIGRCTREISRLEDAMKEEEPVNVQAYYDEKQKEEAAAEQHRSVFAALRQSETKVRRELQEIIEKLREFDEQDEQKAGRLAEFEQRIQEQEEKRQRLIAKMRRVNEKVEERNVRLQEAQSRLQRQERVLEAWMREAQEAFPVRIETTKTPEQLFKEVQAMEALRDEHQKAAGRSMDDVANEFQKAADAYNTAKVDIEHTEKLYKLFKRTWEHRLQRWEQFRMFISITASGYFTYYMHKRGDNGQLKFNHEKEKLEIRVSTGDQFKKGTRHKDSKSLSGGEKSFSQVSLLLAMWQGITSPIFCLDEFDVYMDAVNRKQSMKMMMDSAGENSSQYILITPQDASNMTPGPYVTVHRLADPERRQE